jgi:hypothetical protein
MDFASFVQDITAKLTAAGRREPPEMLQRAAQLVLGAHWPHVHHAHRHHHHHKMHELAHRWPALQDLFTQIHHIVHTHPATPALGIAMQWPQWAVPHFSMTGARHGGGGGGHRWGGHPAHAPTHAPALTPHPHHPPHHHHPPPQVVEEGGALWGGGPWWGGWGPEVVVIDEAPREEDEQRDFEEGPPIGTTAGHARPVVLQPERAIGQPLGVPLNAAWAGVDGYGRDYLTNEQRLMDAVHPFGDGEPDWPVHWSQRG